MKLLLLIIATSVQLYLTQGQFTDIAEPEVIEAMIANISVAQPTPLTVYKSSKELLVGRPAQLVASTIDQFCSAAVAQDAIERNVTVDPENIMLVLRTPCQQYSYPIGKADDLWSSDQLDPNKKVVVYVSGWKTSINDTQNNYIAKAYLCRNDTNFISLEVPDAINTLYFWSAVNSLEIGLQLGSALGKIVGTVPTENLHLIGHGLGAQIASSAAQFFKFVSGETVARLTGLDPAGPCFNAGEELSNIYRGNANFVDIIHTNPGALGQQAATGDVDFYIGNKVTIPPGCVNTVCAHELAWRLYGESVYPGNEKNFIGVRCTSYTKVVNGYCSDRTQKMGYSASRSSPGEYFLQINASPPYGKNAADSYTDPSNSCGLCNVS